MAHAQSVNSFNRLASKDSRSVSQRLSKSATPSSHLSRHRARDSSSSHVLQIPKEGKLSSSHSSVHRSRGSFPLREIAHQTISHSKHSSIADNIQSHKSKSNLDLKVKTEYSGDLYLENSNDVEIPNVNSAAQRGSQITPNLLKENAFEQRSSVNTRSDSPQNVEILSPSPQMHFDTQESEAENIKQKMFEPDLASNTSTGPLDSYYSIRSNSPDTKLRGPIINLIPGSSEDLVGTSKPILYGGYASSFDSDQEIGNSNYASSFESDQEKGPSGNTENIIDQSISPLSAQNETPIIDPPNISSNAATFQSRIHASSTKIAEEPNKSLVMKRQDSDLLASVSQKRMIGAQSSYGLGVPANFDLKNAPAASLQDYPKQTSHSANSLHSKTATDQDQRRDSRSLYFSDQSKSKSIRESISVVRPLSGVPKVSANAPKKLIESHISAGKVSSHQNIATLLNSKQDNKVPEGDAMISISRHSITGSRNLLNIDKSTFRISRSPVSKNSEPSLNRKEPRNDATSPFISKKNQISSNNDIAAGKTTKRTNALGTGTSEYSLSGARIIKEKGFEDQANEFVIPKLNKLSASIDKKISDEIDMVESAIGVLTNGIDQLQAAINSKNIKIIKALEDGDAKLAELLASKTGVLESQISSLAVETNLQTTSHSRLQRDVQSISSSLQHKFSELLQKYEFCQSELERASQTLDSQIQTNRALESRIVEIERIQKADGRKMKELVVDIGTHGDQISSLDKAVKSRVTKTVLEELTRHIFTKEEISKCVDDITDAKIKKQYRNLCRLPAIITNFLKQVPKTVEESVKEKMRLAVQVFDEKMDAIRNEVDAPHTSTRVTQAYRIASANIEKVLRNEMKTWTQTYLSSAIRDASDLRLNFIENVKVEVNTYLEDQMNLFEKTQRNALERDPHIQEFVGHMTREFDEKLFRICEDVAGCKELFTKQLSQPFYRCGQWLWNTGQLKLGSSIPWSVEAANTGS